LRRLGVKRGIIDDVRIVGTVSFCVVVISGGHRAHCRRILTKALDRDIMECK